MSKYFMPAPSLLTLVITLVAGRYNDDNEIQDEPDRLYKQRDHDSDCEMTTIKRKTIKWIYTDEKINVDVIDEKLVYRQLSPSSKQTNYTTKTILKNKDASFKTYLDYKDIDYD